MEFSFLYAIPRTEVLDSFFLGLTRVAGSYGQLWLIIAALLLIFKKTGSSRKVVGFWHLAFHHPARLRREKHGGEGDCSSCHAAKLRIQRGTSHNFP